ncbi:hypothetical protein AMJ57_04345 [Parcubacteria bacterium SG8_24]|nr:MAG: hypothetical protein AMJ57_04345 [Parcubacteria bacterium SG8_24]
MGATSTFALLGVTKYHDAKLIGVVRAPDLVQAARLVGGEVSDVGNGERPAYRLNFAAEAACGRFRAGPCTGEIIAEHHLKSFGSNDPLVYEAVMRQTLYALANVYRDLIIGEVLTAEG